LAADYNMPNVPIIEESRMCFLTSTARLGDA
jgi:hypothetical protein